MKKRLSSILLICCLLCTMLPLAAFATGNPYPTVQTYDDGASALPCTWVAWDEANKRLGLNLNNWHNGGDWAKNARNEGYLVDNNPAVNCIACWSQSGRWGHVAYVYDVVGTTIYIIEGGNKGSMNARNATFSSTNLDRWASSGFKFEGFIHLQAQTPPTPYAQFAPWSSENYTYIRDTDACIGQTITGGGGSWTEVGMILYSADGTELARGSDNPNSSLNNNYCYYANSELGVSLTPGTTYKYKFYAIIDGQTFYSNVGNFTTTGIISPQTISGYCGAAENGKNLSWTIDEDGVLTIYGTGEMIYCFPDAPWDSYCERIKKVVITDGVTNIGGHAFNGCLNLVSITISDTVTSIGHSAFANCEKLENITIPINVSEIGQTPAFDSGIKTFNVVAGNKFFKAVEGVLFSADLTKLICYPSAAERKEYTVPDSVTSIGYMAVCAKKLEKITIPKTVTFFDKGAISPFYESNDVEQVAYFPTVYCYKDSAAYNFAVNYNYNYNYNLPYSVIAESNITASGSCGEQEGKVTWTLDKDGVLTISGTGKMKNYQYSQSPWFNSEDVKSLVVETGVTSIGENAFSECVDLTGVVISDGVESIGNYAFNFCENLSSVSVPTSVKSIGQDAFYNTPYLESLGEFAVINGILLKYQGEATSVAIPETVTEIAGAFCYCDEITDITVPAGVTKISSWYAFGKCLSLKALTFHGSAPYLSDPENMFEGVHPDCVIHAPKGDATWTSSVYYNAATQTWNGLPIVFDDAISWQSAGDGTVSLIVRDPSVKTVSVGIAQYGASGKLLSYETFSLNCGDRLALTAKAGTTRKLFVLGKDYRPLGEAYELHSGDTMLSM